jgi:hypothetical protein
MKAGLLSHLRSNVVGYIAILLFLTSGTAYALDGRNTVFSDDIVNAQVLTADIGRGQVRSGDVANDSLRGLDIDESTLGVVPSALLGGFGRSTGGGNTCDPEGATVMVTCVTVHLTLPAEARVLLIGRVRARTDEGSGDAVGSCVLGSDWTGPLNGSAVNVFIDSGSLSFPQVPLVTVTPLVGPGPVSFGMDCNELSGGANYGFAQISAVALSDN